MKRNGKKSRKIRKLIVACTLSAIILVVSTYTWFIGMQTVNVKPFEIEIATTEGLYLSLDGESWVYNLDVTEATEYTGNTNTFASDGLIPLSSVGDLDSTTSRMKLYEKASLTTSPGGYRLLASQIDNSTVTPGTAEGSGYVAFDLFIKNLSGEAYYVDNKQLNEEAIYLTTDSSVSVSTNGSDELTGIENSVRVAFAQIGRVEATIDTEDDADGSLLNLVTSMDCDGDTTNSNYPVTGICRNAQIWEPNETSHITNALNWYENSCITRKADGSTITSSDSYNVAQYDADGVQTTPATYCMADGGATKTYLDANNNALPTYAISREIAIADNVDVYDGEVFNTYTGNSTTYANYIAGTDEPLVEYPYFTDTMKDLTGEDRPTFMTLAPNSITKVRVYIWIEGQDIDNYDFAQLGKTISIKFGFTKERFTETDVNYDGPALVTSDNADLQ